jgi:hypothetical protein
MLGKVKPKAEEIFYFAPTYQSVNRYAGSTTASGVQQQGRPQGSPLVSSRRQTALYIHGAVQHLLGAYTYELSKIYV